MIKLRKYLPTIVSIFAVSLPLLSKAQAIDTIINKIGVTANLLIGVMFVIATLVFLWGVVKFIASAGDEAGKKTGRGLMMYGIIGLAVMAAAWGVTRILVDYFGAGGAPPARVLPPT